MMVYFKLFQEFIDDNEAKTLFLKPERKSEVQIIKDNKKTRIKYKSEFSSLSCEVVEHSAWIKGSLLVLNNRMNRDFGYSDLSYSALNSSISYLEENIIGVGKMRITGLEFGLNVYPNEPYDSIIKRNILSLNSREYNHNKWNKLKGVVKVFEFYNIHYLIYNKALQLKMERNTLRFELRFIRPIELRDMGVNSIHDLKDKQKLTGIFNLFLKRFEDLVIVDTIVNNEMISKKDRKSLKNYFNSNFWNKNTKQNNYYHRKIFSRLILKYSLDSTKKYLKGQLSISFNDLLNK